MIEPSQLRIAFLYPTVELGAYWQPVLAQFIQKFQNTIFYTGRTWPGFDPQDPDVSFIQVIGQTKFVEVSQNAGQGYGQGFYSVSPNVIGKLIRFRPQVIFTSAFSVWTIFALLLKGLGRWKIIIMWDGSSPNVDFKDARFRLLLRRLLAHFTEAFVTNSRGGRDYLVDTLGVPTNRVFVRPYMVPELKALSKQALSKTNSTHNIKPSVSHTISRPLRFLYVGRIESRKGLHLLLQACALLQRQGCINYRLQIVGTGVQRPELEAFVQEHGLKEAIEWVGWVDYSGLGDFFEAADVFVFPSLEDIWGMVVLEAMAFGKPVLCSKWAGAYELVEEEKNGYVFDPHQPEQLAYIMQKIMTHPEDISRLGEQSKKLMSRHTPKDAADFFADITSHVLQK